MVDKLVNSEANSRRIAVVECCFGNSGQPLGVPGRVLVGEGVLTKMCRKRPKTRQFFLFNDMLVYGNIIINKKKYNKQHIIPLEAVKLESLEDDSQGRNGWLIRTACKSFAVYAATATEKQEWMAHINKCIEDLLRKSGKKAVAEHAAVWVPDGEATVCMHCNKSQFTFLNRRHHCRKCGAVVCGLCSNKRFLLPTQSSKPLRVCLYCYETLLNAAKMGNSSGGSGGGNTDINSTAQIGCSVVDQKEQRNSSEGDGAIAGDSSGEDDSDDEDESCRGQLDSQDLMPKFYGDNNDNKPE